MASSFSAKEIKKAQKAAREKVANSPYWVLKSRIQGVEEYIESCRNGLKDPWLTEYQKFFLNQEILGYKEELVDLSTQLLVFGSKEELGRRECDAGR